MVTTRHEALGIPAPRLGDIRNRGQSSRGQNQPRRGLVQVYRRPVYRDQVNQPSTSHGRVYRTENYSRQSVSACPYRARGAVRSTTWIYIKTLNYRFSDLDLSVFNKF